MSPRVTHFGYGLSNTGGWVATCETHGVTSRTFAAETDARAWRCPECHPEAGGVTSLAALRALEAEHAAAPVGSAARMHARFALDRAARNSLVGLLARVEELEAALKVTFEEALGFPDGFDLAAVHAVLAASVGGAAPAGHEAKP